MNKLIENIFSSIYDFNSLSSSDIFHQYLVGICSYRLGGIIYISQLKFKVAIFLPKSVEIEPIFF